MYLTTEELDDQLMEFVKNAKRELSRANEALARLRPNILRRAPADLQTL